MSASKDGVTLNIVEASIAEAAKSILGDVLGVTYTVSEKVKGSDHDPDRQGRSQGGSARDLRGRPARRGRGHRGAAGNLPRPPDRARRSPSRPSRLRAQAPSACRASPPSRAAAIRGSGRDGAHPEGDRAQCQPAAHRHRPQSPGRRGHARATSTPWRTLSASSTSIGCGACRSASTRSKSADPEAVAQELDTIFANDKESPIKGIVRFVPNRRLKSVLVISSRPEYLRRAQVWARRLDMATQSTVKQVFVYPVRSRTAADLAKLLQKVYGSAGSGQGDTQAAGPTCRRPPRAADATMFARPPPLVRSPTPPPSAPANSAPPLGRPRPLPRTAARRRANGARDDRIKRHRRGRRRRQQCAHRHGHGPGIPARAPNPGADRRGAQPGVSRGHDRRGAAQRRPEDGRALVLQVGQAPASSSRISPRAR